MKILAFRWRIPLPQGEGESFGARLPWRATRCRGPVFTDPTKRVPPWPTNVRDAAKRVRPTKSKIVIRKFV